MEGHSPPVEVLPAQGWQNVKMQHQVPHKELHDPFAHYTRGVLFYDKNRFTFIAYRVPYRELNDRTWDTEQDFMADYHELVARKYSLVAQTL